MNTSTIEVAEICAIEEFDKQCGEVFLSIHGNLSFLCTLCGIKYEGYHSYAEHIMEKHYLPNASTENEFINDFDEMQTPNAPCDETDAIVAAGLDVSNTVESLKKTTQVHLYAEHIMEKHHLSNESTENDFINDFDEMQMLNALCDETEAIVEAGFDVSNTVESLKKINQPQSAKTKNTKATKESARKTHTYNCPNCDFVTKTYSTIMMHIKRHKGKKRHICKECKKGFYTLYELKIHTRSHTGERPYACDDCGQTFVAYSALWRHNKSCKNIRDIECLLCEKKFSTTTALRNHMAVHNEQRCFQCTECNASFKLQKTLANHMKIHKNKLEFKCSYCPASFNQQSGLLSHEKSKHFRAPSS